MMMPPDWEASYFIADKDTDSIADKDADFIDDADTACIVIAIYKIQDASASSHPSVVHICDNYPILAVAIPDCPIGNPMINLVPFCHSLSHRILPLSVSTYPFTIERPRPVEDSPAVGRVLSF
jgi:hypothetical protein